MSQIFISYRREGGEIMAQLLYDKLVARGYTVFYDVESLKSGRFDSKLLEEIEKAEDFLLILPPHGLDRCSMEEDWVRQEIRCAIEQKKNIVPVMLRGFSFPEELPEDISEVSRYNGVNFGTMEFFDAKIHRVVERLKSISPLGDQTSEHEAAAVSGYESFRQRLMAECEDLLETAKHHWSKIVADSNSFAPITHPADRARIRLLLEDIEKWTEKKKDFEQKANSSIDIYGTAYIQDVFHRLEEEQAQLDAYNEELLRYVELFAIEEGLYALKLTCRADYETLVNLSERIHALPEEILEEMRTPAREIFDALWRDYENQLAFEKGATLLEQMLLNLTFDMHEEEHVFVLSELVDARPDVHMAENILQRFDALYAQCAPAEGSDRTPLFVENYQKYIDLIPALKKFVERGKVFIVAGTLCEDIERLNAAEHLTAEEVDELLSDRAELSEEAASYVPAALSVRLDALHAFAEQTAALSARTAQLYAERHEGDAPLSDEPYTYETFESAHAHAYAVESWANNVLALKSERTLLSEQRFFTEADDEKMTACYAEAGALLADTSRPTAAQMQLAHALEARLIAKSESGIFDPTEIEALHAELVALPELVRKLITPAQVQALAEEKAVLDARDTVIGVRDYMKSNCVQLVFENHAAVQTAVEQTARMHELLSALEEKATVLSARFTEIRLPFEELRTDMQEADAYVASTKTFFASYPLYEWRNAHPDVAALEPSDTPALKKMLVSYREHKSVLSNYDPNGETRRYFAKAKSLIGRARSKKVSGVVFTVIAILLFPLLVGGAAALDLLLRDMIDEEGLSLIFIVGFAIGAIVNLILLRRIRAFKTPLFLIPILTYTVYGLCYLCPTYFGIMHRPLLATVSPFVGVALALIFFAAFVNKGAGFAKFFSICALLTLICLPFVAFMSTLRGLLEEMSMEALEIFLESVTYEDLLNYFIEGCRRLFSIHVLGGLWMDRYVDTVMTDLSALFFGALLVRVVCRFLASHRKKKKLKAQAQK